MEGPGGFVVMGFVLYIACTIHLILGILREEKFLLWEIQN